MNKKDTINHDAITELILAELNAKTTWDEPPHLAVLEREPAGQIRLRELSIMTQTMLMVANSQQLGPADTLHVLAEGMRQTIAQAAPYIATPVAEGYEFIGFLYFDEAWTAYVELDKEEPAPTKINEIPDQPAYSNSIKDNPNGQESYSAFGYTVDNKLHTHLRRRSPRPGQDPTTSSITDGTKLSNHGPIPSAIRRMAKIIDRATPMPADTQAHPQPEPHQQQTPATPG